jgi:hypothetical protein
VPLPYLAFAGDRQVPPLEYLRRLFIETAQMHESAAMGSLIRVEVSNGPLVAVFGVEVRRTAYFFKDRDVSITSNGRRQRIFHAVRPHERATKKGVKNIGMHFRGLKQFTWAGYRVKITVPVRDHLALPEFDVGAHDMPFGPQPDYKDMAALGKTLHEWIDSGLGAQRP